MYHIVVQVNYNAVFNLTTMWVMCITIQDREGGASLKIIADSSRFPAQGGVVRHGQNSRN